LLCAAPEPAKASGFVVGFSLLWLVREFGAELFKLSLEVLWHKVKNREVEK
jgi:hypothetical protein